MKDILNIGFMIHQIDNEYTSEILKGMIPAAEELGVNLIILPGQAINGEYYDTVYAAYEFQHNIIYEYCSKESLDGLIISAGTLSSFVSKERFQSFVDQFKDIPLITLESKVADYPCVKFDGSGMYEAVTHLIQKHGLRRIGFVSGPRGNSDAESRLAAYRRALEDNGIEPDESLIAYGNFSEYSMDAVKELLASENGMPEGICFANDSMCRGGYKVLEEMGLIPGKDILITGYDDSETASVLIPPLTTIRSKASALGYSALKMVYGMIKGKQDQTDASPDEQLILRGSCGCICQDSTEAPDISDLWTYAYQTIKRYADEPCGTKVKKLLDEICSLAGDIAEMCTDNSDKTADELLARTDDILKKGCMEIISYVNLMNAVDLITAAVTKCGQCGKARAVSLIREFEHRIYNYEYHRHIAYENDFTNTVFMINNIAKDMTLYADDDTDCFYSVFHKLNLMGIRSSRIYFYDKPIRHRKNSLWKTPEKILLMGSQEEARIEIPKSNSNNVSWKSIFRSTLAPDRPRVSVANVIFSNELHYGIFICETEPSNYRFIHSIVSQLCTSIRMNLLVKSLESSLYREKTNNALLSEISMTDELTHTYNRRGFYHYANAVLHSPSNAGRSAYLIFADLNDLKKINDIFGHEDGDYAIRKTAEILRTNLAPKSIVSRIGGDEFAALTIIDGEDRTDELSEKIKKAARLGNETSDKPYNVTASIGIHSFKCSKDICIQELMDIADSKLYIDKQNKDHNIIKLIKQ